MKIVLCDDKDQILNSLRKSIQNIYNQTVEITTTKMPDILLEDWQRHPSKVPDILIMDIEFPYLKCNGIEIAQAIQNAFPNIKLIFITGKINYAQDIFITQPCAFLLKPIDESRLREALMKAEQMIIKEKEDILVLKTHGGLVKIPTSTIVYIESVGHNIIVHSEGTDATFRMKLTDCLNLVPENFWLIHQSYIIHSKYIRRMTKNGIELKHDIILPVARSKYRDIKEKFFDEMEKE